MAFISWQRMGAATSPSPKSPSPRLVQSESQTLPSAKLSCLDRCDDTGQFMSHALSSQVGSLRLAASERSQWLKEEESSFVLPGGSQQEESSFPKRREGEYTEPFASATSGKRCHLNFSF